MFGRTSRPEPDAIEVLIGPRATFSGRLQCDASIRIDGAVDQGHIETPANVILTETAIVNCDIVARVVSIRGKFKGLIQADRVELLEGSQVGGVLNVNSFYMDDNVLMRAAVNIRADTMADMEAAPAPAHPDHSSRCKPAMKDPESAVPSIKRVDFNIILITHAIQSI